MKLSIAIEATVARALAITIFVSAYMALVACDGSPHNYEALNSAGWTRHGPDVQPQFCSLINDFRQKYQKAEKNGANEAVLSELRHDRKVALASLFVHGEISSWTGKLRGLSTHSDGSAAIAVTLDCPGHPNGADIGLLDDPDIPRTSPLYATLMRLHEGSAVSFDGAFLLNASETRNFDHISGVNLTEFGAMLDPDFKLRFDSIALRETRPAQKVKQGSQTAGLSVSP